MNCVGIDVSKGKSMIAVMRPFGEVVVSPFEVRHTTSELSKLAGLLKSLDGETRVVMESTGNYHAPAARCSGRPPPAGSIPLTGVVDWFSVNFLSFPYLHLTISESWVLSGTTLYYLDSYSLAEAYCPYKSLIELTPIS